MGIKKLNSFLRDNCENSIKCIPLADLSGKKIAVDISIYIYKFLAENALIENMYLMMAIFRYYNIIPIFIFDGKPPAEKKELLQKRREDKREAEKEYNILKSKLEKLKEDFNEEDEDDEEEEDQEIIKKMDLLKKKFIYVTREQTAKIKELIMGYGMTYYDADGEADELCALLVNKKKVWGCLSEDTDMFVYGCKRVLRYISLMKHNVVLYDTTSILEELGITIKEFREICVLSGTDYNNDTNDNNDRNDNNRNNVNNSFKLFRKYHKTNKSHDFYGWLSENTDFTHDYETLNKVYNMFDLSENNNTYNIKTIEKIKIINSQINMGVVKPILEEDGFMFITRR
jgi:flap endonuclease-1